MMVSTVRHGHGHVLILLTEVDKLWTSSRNKHEGDFQGRLPDTEGGRGCAPMAVGASCLS